MHHDAAIRHRLELPAQQQCLLARLPGMRHALRGGLVVARQRTPARYRCPATAPAGRSAACCRPPRVTLRPAASTAVAACGTTRTPVSGDGAIVEALGGDVAQAGDHLVAERTGGEGRVGLDQDDVRRRIGAAEEARRGGAAEPAADHDDARRGLGARNERRGEGGGAGGLGAFISAPPTRRRSPGVGRA